MPSSFHEHPQMEFNGFCLNHEKTKSENFLMSSKSSRLETMIQWIVFIEQGGQFLNFSSEILWVNISELIHVVSK